MQHDKQKRRFAGRGYYIALIVCVIAVGISGYVFVRTARQSAVQTAAPAVISQTPEAQTKPQKPKETVKPSGVPGASEKTSASQDQETDRMEDAYEETMAEAEPLEQEVLWPLQGEVTATFSRDTLTYSRTMADWRTHEGLDIEAEADSSVSATQAGTVTAVYEDDFLGNVVVVTHSGDLATLYANLADMPEVSVGEEVSAGQVLGHVGRTALAETADPTHLHFEVFENGDPVDPLEYLPD